jgi:hypothetical protein
MLLVWASVKVYADHRALKWLLNSADPSSGLTHWAMKLSEYDFILEHGPNSKMRHADAFSRCTTGYRRLFFDQRNNKGSPG